MIETSRTYRASTEIELFCNTYQIQFYISHNFHYGYNRSSDISLFIKIEDKNNNVVDNEILEEIIKQITNGLSIYSCYIYSFNKFKTINIIINRNIKNVSKRIKNNIKSMSKIEYQST